MSLQFIKMLREYAGVDTGGVAPPETVFCGYNGFLEVGTSLTECEAAVMSSLIHITLNATVLCEQLSPFIRAL